MDANTYGLIRAVLAIVGAFVAVAYGIQKLENVEIRKLRVNCIVNLYGLRYVLGPGIVPTDDDRSKLMFEINRAGALFCADAEVQRKLRDFFANRTNDGLFALIHSMGKRTKLGTASLSNADIQNVFLLGK